VAASGGDESLTRYHAELEHLLTARPKAIVIVSTEGAVEETYRSFVDSMN
jgi:hypothetical protein